MDQWELSLEDANGFALKLDSRIGHFPVPENVARNSLAVYSQALKGTKVTHSLGFWCNSEPRYLENVQKYAKAKDIALRIERDRLPGECYVKAQIETEKGDDRPQISNGQ